MKQAKRIISLLLVLVMALGLFTGCKKEEKKEVSKGPRKLTVGIPQKATIPDYDSNTLTTLVEEETGIEIEFIFFASSVDHYKQQLTLMCTGGDELPDVLLFGGLGHYVGNQFGEDGFFMDLTPYLDGAKNYQKALDSIDKPTKAYIQEKIKNTNDGKIYGMPMVASNDELFMDAMQSRLYINQTWLTKLGLKMPTTVAELENVARQFATKDPNGDGVYDDIAILGQMEVANWIMNAFVEYQSGTFNVDKNGKVWDPVQTKEFRQGVQFINKLASEGLFNKLGLTISSTEIKNLVSPLQGVGRVGIISGHHELFTNSSTNALKDYVAMPMLADETGKGGYSVWQDQELKIAAYITKDCKNPEVAMELIDYGYTDKYTTSVRYGEYGVDWVDDDGKNAYGTHSKIFIKNPDITTDFSTNKTWGQDTGLPTHVTWENYMPVVKDNDKGYTGNVARLHAEQVEMGHNTGKERKANLNQLVYTSEEYEIREEKAGQYASEINSKLQLFIAGEQNPKDDKTWNEFLSTLNTLGRDQLMKIAQDAYERKVERNAALK